MVNKILPLEMAMNLDQNKDHKYKPPHKSNGEFKELLFYNMKQLGSKDPEKDIKNFKKGTS